MIFKSLTRHNEIGANSYLLEMDGVRMILDSGMHPKGEGNGALPRYEEVEQDSAEAIFLTHAHLDHVGTLPVTGRHHKKADVFMTAETRVLAEAMLHNSVNVMMHKREELGMTEYPFFTHREIDRFVKSWRTATPGKSFVVGDNGVRAELFYSGHIMGAVGVKLSSSEGSVFYTGDVKFEEQAIVKGADLPTEGIDTLIMETTRGGVSRDPNWSRQGQIDRLADVIRRTYERGGSIMMPVFALGRTQEFLVVLDALKKAGEIPDLPVYIGGLGTKVTTLFDKMADTARRNLGGFRILDEVEVTIASKRNGVGLRYQPGCIYAITSGMMSEKTMSYEFGPRMITNPKDSIVFTGYSDPDSPAGKFRAAGEGGTFFFGDKGPEITAECEIVELAISGHAEREQLMEYAQKVNPSRIVLVHGDPPAIAWFKRQIEETMPDCEAVVPVPGRQYDW